MISSQGTVGNRAPAATHVNVSNEIADMGGVWGLKFETIPKFKATFRNYL